MNLGHVAVVSQVLTDRIVQVTHANWSPIEGSRGKVEEDVMVIDVSLAGDWSKVKVWYDPSRNLGKLDLPDPRFHLSVTYTHELSARRPANRGELHGFSPAGVRPSDGSQGRVRAA